MNIFPNLLILILITIIASLATAAQENTAPIKWERYRLDDKALSVLLPKLPVRGGGGDPCLEKSTTTYTVYANNVAYAVRLVKSKNTSPVWCKVLPFGEETLRLRKQELEKMTNDKGEFRNVALKNATVYRGGFVTIWLINDLENKRWVELEIRARERAQNVEEDFANSLSFTESGSAIKIGKGARVTLGDEPTGSTNSPSPSKTENSLGKPAALVIASKPRAAYTDAARQNNEQGTVLLRVTFLANGSIGNVEVVKSLGYGLTESAIAAVRQITFLPAQQNGVNMAVIRQVEFGFAIY